MKHHFVLALVSPETKARPKGAVIAYDLSSGPFPSLTGTIEADPQAVTPRWPPTPESLLVDDTTYELVTVPLTSVSLVTNRSIKVHYFYF